MKDSYEVKTLSEYQRLLDRFENVNDSYILPDVRLIIRLDAHRHGPEWSEFRDEEYPYHRAIVDALVGTARKLMCLDIRVNYSFIHGDEISLLLDASETIGLRRRARLLSHVASAASLFFLQELKLPVFFRAKLAELPSNSHVMDYFFWQRKVGLRNFFSRAFGMILTQQGLSPQDITQKIGGLTEDAQWQMAKELNLPLDKVPQCFLYGAGLWWQKKESEYEVVINNGLSESDTEILAILNQVISGESYIPTASGKEIGWSVSKELPKKSTKNSSPQPDSGGNFRLGSVKGAKIISKS